MHSLRNTKEARPAGHVEDDHGLSVETHQTSRGIDLQERSNSTHYERPTEAVDVRRNMQSLRNTKEACPAGPGEDDHGLFLETHQISRGIDLQKAKHYDWEAPESTEEEGRHYKGREIQEGRDPNAILAIATTVGVLSSFDLFSGQPGWLLSRATP